MNVDPPGERVDHLSLWWCRGWTWSEWCLHSALLSSRRVCVPAVYVQCGAFATPGQAFAPAMRCTVIRTQQTLVGTTNFHYCCSHDDNLDHTPREVVRCHKFETSPRRCLLWFWPAGGVEVYSHYRW